MEWMIMGLAVDGNCIRGVGEQMMYLLAVKGFHPFRRICVLWFLSSSLRQFH
jgi:hypothetical protein